VQSPKLRQAIRLVLNQIRTCAPEDFKRLQRRVIRFADRDSALGWKKHTMARFANFQGYGIIYFSNKIAPEDLKLSVAHELGHACERPRDFRRRHEQREFIADDYSYKWGFGRIILPFDGSAAKIPSSMLHVSFVVIETAKTT
jgi:hypothetical protein